MVVVAADDWKVTTCMHRSGKRGDSTQLTEGVPKASSDGREEVDPRREEELIGAMVHGP